MKNFTEWMELKNKFEQTTEAQRRALMGIKLGIEHTYGQIKSFDLRSLVQEETRKEVIRLTNSMIGPNQLTSRLKETLVAQYNSGRREASQVIKDVNALEKASAELVVADNDYNRTESMDYLNKAMINIRWSANGLVKSLDKYLT